MVTAAEYNDQVAKAMLEGVLQERVRQLLILHGWRHYHTYRSKRSPAGFPDECAIRGDRLLFAELKRERGKLSPEQEQWRAELRHYGRLLADAVRDDEDGLAPRFEVYVWRPSDLLSGRIEEILR